MFKKTLILTASALAILTSNLIAEPKISPSGEVAATFLQTTEKSADTSISYMDMTSSAVLGFNVEMKGASTTTAVVRVETTDDGAVVAEELSLGIQTSGFTFKLGFMDPSGITLGNDYLNNIDNSLAVGETIGSEDYFTLGLDSVGLNLVLGFHDKVADGTTDAYSEQVTAAFFSKGFGKLTAAASYTSVSESVNKDRSPALVNGSHDGGKQAAVAVAIGMKLDSFGVSLNVDQLTITDPTLDDKSVVATNVLIGDLHLSKVSGLTLAVSSKTTSDGSDNPETYSGVDLGYMHKVGMVAIHVAYSTYSTKDDDTKTDDTVTQVGAGLYYEF